MDNPTIVVLKGIDTNAVQEPKVRLVTRQDLDLGEQKLRELQKKVEKASSLLHLHLFVLTVNN
jgi:hypothetical protein